MDGIKMNWLDNDFYTKNPVYQPLNPEKDTVANQYNAGIEDKKADGVEACQTCKNRRYQDGSNDPGVSFKTPTKVAPSQAASSVRSHEQEHYTREDAKAKREGKEVLSNNIQIFTAVCPECGRTYVSGGETTTVTRKKSDRDQEELAKQFFDKSVGQYLPKELDVKV